MSVEPKKDQDFATVTNDPKKIQLERLHHAIYAHDDLAAFEAFAPDFGLTEVWRDEESILYAGYGIDQYCYVARKADAAKGKHFQGPAFVAQSADEFKKAVALAGKPPRSLSPWPGGGEIVTIETPRHHQIHVIYGQQDREPPTKPKATKQAAPFPYNGTVEKQRKGQYQRFEEGPAQIHKLGHLGYLLVDGWEEEMAFYTSNFNFVPSDIEHLPVAPFFDVIAFMHLDLGERYSDHHCLFVARAPPGVTEDKVHHASFEVEDFDTQLLGHQWLEKKGYESVWGVGRHILGSQIFDYWKDTSGFKVEHYCDGDLVNRHHKTGRSPAKPPVVWGPPLPAEFSS